MRALSALQGLMFFLAAALAQGQEMRPPIGVIVPLTGDFARYGQKIRTGLEQVKPPGVQYVYEDEGCDPAKAVSAYQKLSAVNGIRFFLGPWCGSPQMAVAPLLAKHRQIAVLGASAPRAVYQASGGRVFSSQHSIEEESIFNARQAYRLGAKRVVILFFENSFSRAHEAAFREAFRGEVLQTFAYQSLDVSVIKSLALSIKRLNPDALYVPDAFPLMHGLLRELHQVGLKGKRIFSVYSAQSEDVLKAVGPYGEGMIYSYPAIGDKEALEHFPALAAQILLRALKKCPAAKENCVIQALRAQNSFDQFGVLQGKLTLKTIKEGRFGNFSDL